MIVLDFNQPLQLPTGGGSQTAGSFVPDENALAMIMSMGFTVEQATKALKATVSTPNVYALVNKSCIVFSHLQYM